MTMVTGRIYDKSGGRDSNLTFNQTGEETSEEPCEEDGVVGSGELGALTASWVGTSKIASS